MPASLGRCGACSEALEDGVVVLLEGAAGYGEGDDVACDEGAEVGFADDAEFDDDDGELAVGNECGAGALEAGLRSELRSTAMTG